MNKHIYIIVENVKKPIIKELKTYPHNDGYIVFNQNKLKEIVGNKLFKKFQNRALFKTQNPDRKDTATTSVQRLVACLYDDKIAGLEIHHINDERKDNKISNLVPLDEETHKIINGIEDKTEMQKQGEEKHQEWFNKINEPKRSTLANNSDLQLEIIKYAIDKKTKEVLKKFKSKISDIKKIREIINKFFYKKEFLKEIKNNQEVIFDS